MQEQSGIAVIFTSDELRRPRRDRVFRCHDAGETLLSLPPQAERAAQDYAQAVPVDGLDARARISDLTVVDGALAWAWMHPTNWTKRLHDERQWLDRNQRILEAALRKALA